MTTTSTTTSRGLGRPLRPTVKVLPAQARAHNRSLVLSTLFHVGPLTRADLARRTGLTRVTISDLMNDVIEEGLVEEIGLRPGTHIGKPATLVALNSNAFQIVAVDLSDDAVFSGAVLDLAGTIVTRKSIPLEDRVGEDAIALLITLCRRLVKAATRPILGVGVGSPGIIHFDGTVAQAPNLGWYGVPLAQTLHEALDLPVHVANDARTAALAEHTFGGAGSDGLMVIAVGHGVGSGIVLDGLLIHGRDDAAGEIGHVTVDDRGEMCACGRRGCLETVLAVPALRARIAGNTQKASDVALASVGRRLGQALAPVVSALNLREVLLSGPVELLDGPLREAALTTIRERSLSSVGEGLEVRMASLGEDGVLSGAAVLVLSGQLGVS